MNAISENIGVKPPRNSAVKRTGSRVGPLPMWLCKCVVFLALLSPFMWMVYALLTNQLGANPIDAITDFTGEWSLRILLLSLAMTPLRIVLKAVWPIRFRRMVGLFAFFYVSAHLLTYLYLDQQFDWKAIFHDVIERPYITVGTLAFLIMLPLAITSSKRIARKMGKSWNALHRFVYIAAVAAVLHYIWLARGNLVEPLIYLVILAALLLIRVKKMLG